MAERLAMDGRAALVPGVAAIVAPGVRRIVAPNAGLMTGPGTNTYLLGDDDVAVLDPGPDDETHLEAILGAARGNIRWILVTHTHRDHSPLTVELKRRTSATVIGLPAPADGRQDERFRADRIPFDGERLSLAGTALTVLHTPGHASNCVCYGMASARLLFTGDHVLEGVSPVILPPDGDMSAYLASLDKLSTFDFEYIAPGHGALMPEGPRMVSALRRHRLLREAKVHGAVARLGRARIEQLTPVVYDDVPVERHAWASLTLEAHLIKLVRDGRVLEESGYWSLRHP